MIRGSKTSGSLCQDCRYVPSLNNDGNIAEFNVTDAADSFKFKAKITGQTGDNGRKIDVEIMVPLKHLSNFW